MSADPMFDIVFVTDGNPMTGSVLLALPDSASTKIVHLNVDPLPSPGEANLFVYCFVTFGMREFDVARRLNEGARTPPIFFFPTFNKHNVDLAASIEGSAYFMAPLIKDVVLSRVAQALNQAVEAGWRELPALERRALETSLAGFDAAFAAAAKGERMPMPQVLEACENIQSSIDNSAVDRWLSSLQRHHNMSFRHSMFVCGALSFFAYNIGIRGDDLRDLTVGGFLHDAGKARIPLAILDKPDKLDADEWRLMQSHPKISREILMSEQGLSENIVRMAVHHHEKLDGTGYPDGLSASQIEDVVRLTTVADVYAALAERRSYKDEMSDYKAFEVMQGMTDHLDANFVAAFREFILDTAPEPVAAGETALRAHAK